MAVVGKIKTIKCEKCNKDHSVYISVDKTTEIKCPCGNIIQAKL